MFESGLQRPLVATWRTVALRRIFFFFKLTTKCHGFLHPSIHSTTHLPFLPPVFSTILPANKHFQRSSLIHLCLPELRKRQAYIRIQSLCFLRHFPIILFIIWYWICFYHFPLLNVRSLQSQMWDPIHLCVSSPSAACDVQDTSKWVPRSAGDREIRTKVLAKLLRGWSTWDGGLTLLKVRFRIFIMGILTPSF